MQRINHRLVVVLIVATLAGIGAVAGLHRFNVVRNAESILDRARERRDEGRSAEAAGFYTRYLALRPSDGVAQAELAIMLLEGVNAGNTNRAAVLNTYNALEAAVRQNPDDDSLREKLGRFLLRVGSPIEAKQHFSAILDRRLRGDGKSPTPGADASDDASSDAVINLLFAQACAGAGEYDEASRVTAKLIGYDPVTKIFDTSFEALPDCADAYVLLSDLLERRFKDKDSATKVIRRLPEAYPKDSRAWLAMARWSYDNGDLAAAAIEIANATEISPYSPEVAFADFEIAMRTGNVARAERLIRESMAPYGEDARVIVGRADLALAQGDPVAAIEILEAGAESAPDSPAILHQIGRAHV